MKTYIITLPDRPDRVANAKAMSERLRLDGFEPVLFPAIRLTGYEFSSIEYIASRDLERPMTAGELACAWSHYRVCEAIADSGEPAFVLEDDALLFRDLSSVQTDDVAHILSGSAWHPEHQHDEFTITHTDHKRQMHHTEGLPYGTQGYFLTPTGAAVLARYLPPIRWASDVALDRLSKRGVLQTRLAVDPWAGQNNDIPSHIRQ